MTGSLVHLAFDPHPYLAFSAGSVAMGVVFELDWTRHLLQRCFGPFRRTAANATGSWTSIAGSRHRRSNLAQRPST
jgi:hypothetical protein